MRLRNGVFTAPLLARQKWLGHAFGTRRATGPEPAPGAGRQPASALRWFGLGLPAATLKQIHSGIVHVVEGAEERLTGDALVTATPGLALAVETADCLPVLLADPEHHAVAAVHAGWRGTLQRIAEKTVGVMRRQFGANPGRLVAALGPAIHACCYGVGPEVLEQYRSQFPYAEKLFRHVQEENPVDILVPRQILVDHTALLRPLETSRAYLDLEEALCRQLLAAGLSPRHIARGAPCTACRTDLLYSYRKEGAGAGRMLAQIAIRPA